jgi:hypothetical protein
MAILQAITQWSKQHWFGYFDKRHWSIDGHSSYLPDSQWVITDTYLNREDRVQTLMLYYPESNRRIDIGRFFHPPEYFGEYRCDLHPRWNREGSQICVDFCKSWNSSVVYFRCQRGYEMKKNCNHSARRWLLYWFCRDAI